MTDADERSIQLSIEVPGSAEEVWKAIATGPGVTSWFVPTEVEEREGGVVRHDFGAMGDDSGNVVSWEAPRRVVFEGNASNGKTLAFEWIVEGGSGDSCIVRFVASGFGFGEEWDGDYDGMSKGWPLFLQNLRLYLTHFRSQAATTVVPFAMVAGPNAEAWQQLCNLFGIATSAGPEAEVALAVDGALWRARVDAATVDDAVRHYSLLLNEPRGTVLLAAEGEGDHVAVSGYLYLYGDDADQRAAQWTKTWEERWTP